MANHIRNRLTLSCEHQCSADEFDAMVDEVYTAIQYDKNEDNPQYGHGTIDFNKIIPEPIGVDWYSWRIKNWNTKWNAYDIDDMIEGVVIFSTAWSPPHPVIEKLAKMFPNITIDHIWADEDMGYNCGSKTYISGKCVDECIPDGDSKEAYEIGFDVWEQLPEECGYTLSKDEAIYTMRE